MSEIRAIREDGGKGSMAKGNLKSILKMISSLPESKSHQIIINKKKLDSFSKTNDFRVVTLQKVKAFEVWRRKTFTGKLKKISGSGQNFCFELYYIDISDSSNYILNKAFVNGKVVYITPEVFDNIHGGLMELTV